MEVPPFNTPNNRVDEKALNDILAYEGYGKNVRDKVLKTYKNTITSRRDPASEKYLPYVKDYNKHCGDNIDVSHSNQPKWYSFIFK
jgi:hypothetical protein